VLKDVGQQMKIRTDCHIDKVVLFSTLVHPEIASTKEEFSQEMNKLQNILRGAINPLEARINSINELVNAINAAPEYFMGFGACPFGLDIEKTGGWIEKYIVGNNLKGIGEVTLGQGNVLMIENIFQYVHERKKKLPIWIHTFNPLSFTDIKEVVNLAEKYNTVKVILGHGGGSNWLETIDLIQNNPNIYMDISASFTVLSIKYIAEALPERCLFSSDLPYGDPFLCIKQIEHIIKDKQIRDNVLGLNTKQLLGI
jgi:predicted TIM-barrel fold metal-dependent hydrolase